MWYDILLDGPRKREQMERLKLLIRDVGKAGIPVFGYNFSIAGVWGHTRRNAAAAVQTPPALTTKTAARNIPFPTAKSGT